MASCLYHHPIGVFPLHVWFGAPLREENRSLSFATTTANTCLGGNTASPLVAQLRSSALCPTVKVICCPKNVVKSCVSAVLVHATFDQVYLDRRVLCWPKTYPWSWWCWTTMLHSPQYGAWDLGESDLKEKLGSSKCPKLFWKNKKPQEDLYLLSSLIQAFDKMYCT